MQFISAHPNETAGYQGQWPNLKMSERVIVKIFKKKKKRVKDILL